MGGGGRIRIIYSRLQKPAATAAGCETCPPGQCPLLTAGERTPTVCLSTPRPGNFAPNARPPRGPRRGCSGPPPGPGRCGPGAGGQARRQRDGRPGRHPGHPGSGRLSANARRAAGAGSRRGSRSTGRWPPPGWNPARSRGGGTRTRRRWRSWFHVLHELAHDLADQIRSLGADASEYTLDVTHPLEGEPLTLTGPEGQLIDLGRVGRVTGVNSDRIAHTTDYGRTVPVIPSLARTIYGGWLNVNADTAAAAVAGAMKAESCLFLSDTPGRPPGRGRPPLAPPAADPGRVPDTHRRRCHIRRDAPEGRGVLRGPGRRGRPGRHPRRPRPVRPAAEVSCPTSPPGPPSFRSTRTHPLRGWAFAPPRCYHDGHRHALVRRNHRPVPAVRHRQLHALPGGPRPRRGVVGVGRRGEPVSRLLPRLGLWRPGPLPAAGRASRARAGRHPHPCAEHLAHGAAGPARPGPVRAHGLRRRLLLLQQRGRGRRGRHQGRPPPRGSPRGGTRSSR